MSENLIVLTLREMTQHATPDGALVLEAAAKEIERLECEADLLRTDNTEWARKYSWRTASLEHVVEEIESILVEPGAVRGTGRRRLEALTALIGKAGLNSLKERGRRFDLLEVLRDSIVIAKRRSRPRE